MRLALILGLLALAGCASAPVTLEEGSPKWLVGAWVLAEDPCDMDGGVIFNDDGTWETFGVGGTWVLNGNKLDTTITERWEIEGGDTEPVVPPEAYTETISAMGPNHYSTQWSDGSRHTLVRC